MNQQKIKVGILETGRPPAKLAAEYGDYPGMVRQWLDGLEAEFSAWAVLDGDFPDSPDQADLWIITGSKNGAYEDHPWIPPLKSFILDVRDAGKMMFGICFGHQIIALALGGDVRKSGKGWGLGIHEYHPTPAWPAVLGNAPGKIAIQAYHQDQIEKAPDCAVTIAASPFCEFGALWYPGFAVTVQGHPEFDKPYAGELLDSRRGTVLTHEEVERGKRNMATEDNRFFLADLVRNHLVRKQEPA